MPTLLRMSAGALVWAAHFAAIYGATAFACARGDPRVVPWVVALSTLVGVAFSVAIIVRSYPRRDDFTHWMAAAVAAMATIAMLWEAMAGLVVRTCG
jgi:predicted transporter